MFDEWLLLSIVSLIAIYLLVKIFYLKSIIYKEQKNNAMIKRAVQDGEELVQKYQHQLQRSLGNIDMLSDELDKLRSELKSIRSTDTKHRLETKQLNNKIKELEERITHFTNGTL